MVSTLQARIMAFGHCLEKRCAQKQGRELDDLQ